MPFAHLRAEEREASGALRHNGPVVKAPQGLSSSGCGYAVSLYRNFDAALGLLRSSGLISGKIFSRADGGEYKELAR